MLKKVSYTVGSHFRSYDLPPNKLVGLVGDKIQCDTFLSILERCIASDFSHYFDDFDLSKGIKYTPELGNVHLEFDYGSLSYVNNNFIKRLATRRDFYCIRYINNLDIRSFVSPLVERDIPNSLGVSLTSYSSALSKSSWLRLRELYNNMCGFNAVHINPEKKELSFNFNNDKGWSEEALKLAYIILAESFVSARKGIRIILLSEINIMSESQFTRFLDALYHVSNLECICFCNQITSVRRSNLSDLGLLKL